MSRPRDRAATTMHVPRCVLAAQAIDARDRATTAGQGTSGHARGLPAAAR